MSATIVGLWANPSNTTLVSLLGLEFVEHSVARIENFTACLARSTEWMPPDSCDSSLVSCSHSGDGDFLGNG
jgi:hypothetical protein